MYVLAASVERLLCFAFCNVWTYYASPEKLYAAEPTELQEATGEL